VSRAQYGNGFVLQFLFDSDDAIANEFEGWYVDDVRVRPILDVSDADVALTSTDLAGPNIGTSLAPIGDFDGDMIPDFALSDIFGAVYVVYGRDVGDPPLVSGEIAGQFGVATITETGDDPQITPAFGSGPVARARTIWTGTGSRISF
jgi:hypothetical protein